MNEYNSLIPECILSSFEYIELNEASRHDIEERIDYCLEVMEAVKAWLTCREDTLENFLDNLELDCLSIVSSGFGNTENHVSIYQFHSSWTDACSKRKLNDLISAEAINLFDEPLPSFNSKTDELIEWLKKWESTLAITIRAFITADTFDIAICSMITLDNLILSILCVTSAARLNPNI
jgi:hypothetical protein